MNRSWLAVPFVLSMILSAGPAFADDEDKAACQGKEEGEDCTRGDGDPGTCQMDDSDAVLSCDDDAQGSSDDSSSDSSDDSSSSGCSAAGGTPSTTAGVALVLGMLAMRRRSRAAGPSAKPAATGGTR